MGHAYSKYDSRYIQTKPKEEEKGEKWAKRLKLEKVSRRRQEKSTQDVERTESIREYILQGQVVQSAKRFMS